MSYFSYNPQMKPIELNDKTRETINILLEHDPKMISYVKDLDFETAKSVLKKSVTNFNRIRRHFIKNNTEFLKILNYSYDVNKSARRFIINNIHDLSENTIKFNNGEGHEYYTRFSFNKEDYPEVKKILEKIIKKHPLYIFLCNKKVLNFYKEEIKLDISLGINSKNALKVSEFFIKHISRKNSSSRYYNFLDNLLSKEFYGHYSIINGEFEGKDEFEYILKGIVKNHKEFKDHFEKVLLILKLQ
jgi:hypothetical protein